jgi:hypothetical protein
MKEAHKLTKEIKAEYPNVDYMAQLGICIAYLSENKGEVEMVELQGSEKQIAWAEEIRYNFIKMFDEKLEEVTTDKKSTKGEVIRIKECFPDTKTVAKTRTAYIEGIKETKEAILNRKDARWFITYRTNDVETFVDNYFTNRETVFFKEA